MNIVGEKSVLIGTIHCEGDLLVAGRLEGTITSKGTLHVCEGGVVKGTVRTNDLTVAGLIQGEIEVSNRLRVKSSAKLEACVNTRFLDWEEGAELEGELNAYY